LPASSSICRINGRNTSSFGLGLCFACRYPGGSSCASIFLRVCQPTLRFAIAARLLKAPVSTSRRISLQISMSLRTPVPLSERGCDRGCRPDRLLAKNCTGVRCHCGPPRHGPRAAVFDRRQQLTLELADAKPGFQDFVIVHELLHLRVPKHGRVFRALMTAYVPGWRKHDATRRLRSGAKSGTA